jgi:hypothetical protein
VEYDDDGWLVQEVAPALRLTERQARDRVEFGVSVQRYESVALACSLGAWQSWTARRLVDHLDTLASCRRGR